MSSSTNPEEVRRQVRIAYADSARTLEETGRKRSVSAGSSSCCGSTAADVPVDPRPAEQIYSPADLAALPADVAGASWGCGDPVTLAGIQPGDVVVDLGSGGGLDCLLASRRAGPTGRVIGVDMTPEMLSLAWKNVAKTGANNVEFRYGTIERLPVDSNTVNWVISNCVINLSPDKPAVFREIARVLKAGGRVSVSDTVLLGEIPADLKSDVDLYAACVGGALQEQDYLAAMRNAGLSDVTVASRVVIDPHEFSENVELAARLEGVIASVRVTATKA
jgi:arsenite methyltransferase